MKKLKQKDNNQKSATNNIYNSINTIKSTHTLTHRHIHTQIIHTLHTATKNHLDRKVCTKEIAFDHHAFALH